MNAALLESPVTEGIPSLEVRWMFPGQLETAVAEWFGRFPAETESRQDIYLLDPDMPGLSVKVRAGRALEVKAYRGSPGALDLAGRAQGRMQFWQKWSFPFGLPGQDIGHPAGWRPVYKRRRVSWFSLTGERIEAGSRRLAPEPGCAVELTEICSNGKAWWSLGFEALGPADLLRGELEATAAVVFEQALPGGVEPAISDSRSYAEWLYPQPHASADTEA